LAERPGLEQGKDLAQPALEREHRPRSWRRPGHKPGDAEEAGMAAAGLDKMRDGDRFRLC
jgi:hypothetical protein